MDPLTIAAIVAALGATGASIYGASQSDRQDTANRNYAMGRDALADKRQAEQLKRQEFQEMLNRIKQNQTDNARMWQPSMAQRPPQVGG